MARFSRQSRTPLSQGQATLFAAINQLATPGLGSWLGGRRLVGAGQIVLGVAGCLMILGWMVWALVNVTRQNLDLPPLPTSLAWLGKWG